MPLLLLLLLLGCGAGQGLRGWCDGRVLCSDEAADSRSCVLVEASLELAENGVFLNKSHPAAGALAVDKCEDGEKLPSPLLSNAFGVMSSSRVFGEVEVAVSSLARCRGRGEWSTCRGKNTSGTLACVLKHSETVYVMLNRDMTGNIFHILCNTMYPLFRMREQLGIDFRNNRTRVLLVDAMDVSGVEMELLQAVLGGSRVDAMAPEAAQCFGAIVVGAGRHWRTWLHGKSRVGELIPYANWLKNAFQIVSRNDSANVRPLITVVDRKGTRAVLNMDVLITELQTAFPNSEVRRQAFEQLSFSEQLKLVARTEVLIAVHGAALALLPFLDSVKSSVIELLPLGFAETEFYGNLARAAGVAHLAISANVSQQPAAVIEADAPMESALVVDTSRVIAAIQSHFAKE